jgi:hypothetical protein
MIDRVDDTGQKTSKETRETGRWTRMAAGTDYCVVNEAILY